MHRNAKHSNKGFTLAETLIVVAIVIVLMGVAFVAVMSYQRSTKLLEMDGIAKEIYVAAQNHLSLADSQGLIDQRDDDKRGSASDDVTGVYATDANPAARLAVRYYVVPTYDNLVSSSESVLSLMLPMAAVDDTVRLGGSYIVVYDCNSATVLDVFYSNRSTVRFGHDFLENDNGVELKALLDSYRENGRNNRKNYNGAVIGWYGGAQPYGSIDPSKELKIKDFTIYNDDTLRVVVPDPGNDAVGGELRLIVRGKDSGETKVINLIKKGESTLPANVKKSGSDFIVTLDDITVDGLHFTQLFPDFHPGEDIELTLEAYSSTEIVKMPAPIGPKTTNSLFASVSGTTAEITSFRHLENLDPKVSGMGDSGKALATPLTGAQQSADLDWNDFFASANGEPAGDTILGKSGGELGVGSGDYFPVNMLSAFDYTGNNYSVSNVTTSYGGDAGLFGIVSGGTVSDLELVDFHIASTGGNAGALAGRITQSETGALPVTVRNVLVRDSAGGVSDPAAVTGAQGAGGLIGLVNGTGSSVVNCGAAVRVTSTGGDAGGLIGAVGGTGASVMGCYSGGRTENGVYNRTAYNVTAASGHSGGGLIGDAGSAAIASSYSTCSASGTTVGGLAGKAGGAVSRCYATGLVSGATAGAFIGDYSGAVSAVSESKYYVIVNETVTGSGVSAEVSYLPAFGHTANTGSYDVTALDADASAYNAFVGPQTGWDKAKPYDGVLAPYYQGGYPLRSVSRMGAGVTSTDFVAVHYGDWPAPELRVMNVK